MKNKIIILVIGIILGVVIMSSFKGCGKDDTPKIKYVDRIVEIPTDSIVYLPGEKEYIEVPVKIYVPKIDSITGDTIYTETEVPVNVPVIDRVFKYETDSVSAYGNLSIKRDTAHGYLFPKLDNFSIKYTEKQITTVKKRTFGLYAGAGVGLNQWDIKAVSLDLDLAIKQRTLIGASLEKQLVGDGDQIYWIKLKRSIFK